MDVDTLRRIWAPISPQPYLERVRNLRTLLVYAQYDLTFPAASVAIVRAGVPRPRHSAPARGAAVRALQHRQVAVQVPRRLLVDEVPVRGVVRPTARRSRGTGRPSRPGDVVRARLEAPHTPATSTGSRAAREGARRDTGEGRTSGDTSPGPRRSATVTGSVSSSHSVATASVVADDNDGPRG